MNFNPPIILFYTHFVKSADSVANPMIFSPNNSLSYPLILRSYYHQSNRSGNAEAVLRATANAVARDVKD